jgi:hypothetical protein
MDFLRDYSSGQSSPESAVKTQSAAIQNPHSAVKTQSAAMNAIQNPQSAVKNPMGLFERPTQMMMPPKQAQGTGAIPGYVNTDNTSPSTPVMQPPSKPVKDFAGTPGMGNEQIEIEGYSLSAEDFAEFS